MRKLILLTSLILLSACGTTGVSNSALLDQPIPSKQARLVVTRTNSMLYFAGAADVSLNGRKIVSLGRGGSTIENIQSGRNVLSVIAPGTFGNYTTTFEAKAGKIYTFEVAPNDNKSMMPGAVFGMLGEAVDAHANENTGYFQIVLKGIK